MKKQTISFLLISSCFSVTAETTLEMLQQRIKDRDPMAQTLLGLMYENGYFFERSEDKARTWYQKGKDGGDEFAGSRLQALDEEISLFGTDIKTGSSGTAPSKAASFRAAPSRTAPSKMSRSKATPSSNSTTDVYAEASFAELVSKTFDMEDLQRKRSALAGKVVKLEFDRAHFYGSGSSISISVRDQDYRLNQTLYLPDDEDAIDWAVDCDEDGGGDSVYIFVKSRSRIYAVGTRKKKQGEKHTYSW